MQLLPSCSIGMLRSGGTRGVGIPVGIPEAFCAVALVNHTFIKRNLMGHDLHDHVSIHRILECATRDERGLTVLYDIALFLAHAVKRGWVCPLALEYAKGLQDARMAD
jgi:hypothetical protein